MSSCTTPFFMATDPIILRTDALRPRAEDEAGLGEAPAADGQSRSAVETWSEVPVIGEGRARATRKAHVGSKLGTSLWMDDNVTALVSGCFVFVLSSLHLYPCCRVRRQMPGCQRGRQTTSPPRAWLRSRSTGRGCVPLQAAPDAALRLCSRACFPFLHIPSCG